MALKRLDHMNENMRKHLNGRCVMNYTPVRKVKTEKAEKEKTQTNKTGEQKNV